MFPGSLGVFESAVVLLLQPTEAQTLPLIGSLLAFRAVYYLLPLTCGVVVLAISELHRWRTVLLAASSRLRLDLGPRTTQIAATLVAVAGLALIAAAMEQGARDTAPAQLLRDPSRIGRAVETIGGTALVLLTWGLWRQLVVAWRWVLGLLVVTGMGAIAAGAPTVLVVFLAILALLLFACRDAFRQGEGRAGTWQSPLVAVLLVVSLASSIWLIARG